MAYPSFFLLLTVIGVANTVYLSYHAYHKTPVRCIFFPNEWCQKVKSSSFSKLFGLIPNAYLGFLMYAALFVLTLLWLNGIEYLSAIKVIVGIGFAFSLYFTAVQAFILRAFCTWCVLSAIEFVLLFSLVFVF